MKTILRAKFYGKSFLKAYILIAVFCFGSSAFAISSKSIGSTSVAINSIQKSTSSPTNAASVQFTVTFSGAVGGVNTSNFSLTTSSGITGASVTSVTPTDGSGSIYTVTVNTGTGDGTIELDMANSSGLAPGVSTPLPFAGDNYTIDKTIPYANTLYDYSSNTNQSLAVIGDVVSLVFGSDEPIASYAITIAGHPVTGVLQTNGQYKASYTMTANDDAGRVHFTVEFTDPAGNSSGTYNDLGAGADIEFSKTLPSASNVTFVSNNANNTTAIIGNKVTLTFTASEAIQPPVITISGHTVTATNTGGNTYTANYTLVADDPSGNVAFDAALVDQNNATTHITNVTTSQNVLFNNTPTLSFTGSITAMNSTPGTASSSRQFRVSGYNLSAGIIVQPPTGFEVSLDNVHFSRQDTAGGAGIVPSTVVYIRLEANELSGTYGSYVLLGSPHAAGVNIPVPASTIAAWLKNLVISSGTLLPAFSSTQASYIANVPGTVASITVTPTNADGVAPITVNGSSVTSQYPSAPISLALGQNIINTVVTSADGTLSKTYTVKVNRIASTNAALSGLKLSNGTLSPVFATGTLSYTASVTNAISAITVKPASADANATITVNGATVVSGASSASIPLTVGANTITTVVTAQDGSTTKTYTVSVTRASSNTATLAALHLSAGTLLPAFAAATPGYSESVSSAVSTVTVTAKTTDPSATIKVNGTAVASGAASQSITLNFGANVINVVVTAGDGTTAKTYTVTVNKAFSNNDNLSSLKTSSGTLSPAFTQANTGYTESVTNAVSSITVTPTVADANATVMVNGTAVISGAASTPIALNVGVNNINVTVTAQDGTTTKTYIIAVTRAASANANLSALHFSAGTLSPTFAATTTSYSENVTNAITGITVTAKTADPAATIKVNGTAVASGAASQSIPLNIGANPISVSVTAGDGTTTNTYTVTVTRAALSTDALLSALQMSGNRIFPYPFSPGVNNYTVTVPDKISSVTLTPTADDASATIKVNGTAVVSGASSASIPLVLGTNTITTVVTAQDGSTIKTYTLRVTRDTIASQTITFPPLIPLEVGTPGIYPTVFASSGLDVTLTSSNPAVATVTNGFLEFIHPGTTILTASQPGNDYYKAAPNVSQTYTVLPVPIYQQILLIGIPARTYGSPDFDPGAAATSGMPITYSSSDTAVATIVNGKIHIKGPGETVIHVAQAGNIYYTPADNQYTFVVNKAPLTIMADNKNKVVGTVNPPLTIAYQGLVYGQTSDVLLTQPAISTTAATASPLGSYPITVSGATAANYNITYVNGTLTVVSGPLSSNARLTSMHPGTGVLSPSFTGANSSYTESVPNSVSTIAITPTAADPNATIEVNGVRLASGTASMPITLNTGANIITTQVTAQDNATTMTYTLTVNRGLSNNANLVNIYNTENSPLSPAFTPGTINYTTTVNYLTNAIIVSPTAADTGATIKVNGVPILSGDFSAPIAITRGNNYITTVVTSQDGSTTKTYTLKVYRPGSNNDGLDSVRLNVSTDFGIYREQNGNLVATVPNEYTSVRVTPVTIDTTATVTVNGKAVVSNTPSTPIPLAVGVADTITLVITAQDGVTRSTVLLILTRDKPSQFITFSTVPVRTYGDPDIGLVASSNAGLPISFTSSDTTVATIINGKLHITGTGQTFITATAAADSEYVESYGYQWVSVAKAPLTITADNKSRVTGAANPALTVTYNGFVYGETPAVLLTQPAVSTTATTTSPSGTYPITVSGATAANYNIAFVNGTLTVNSNNARLASLHPSAGVLSPSFTGTNGTYTEEVPDQVSSITVTPTTADSHATITVNGTPVASGTASNAIALSTGANTILMIVTAQDGVTSMNYTLNVTRDAPAGNAIADQRVKLPGKDASPTTIGAANSSFEDDILLVHQAVSPNGDGRNDVLTIDGILAYPDNKLQIMSQNGQLIYAAKGYDNTSKAFDGHSNITGKLQQAGTYFYSLDYTVKGQAKHKTGYIVLKY